jgi:hypothetical protein
MARNRAERRNNTEKKYTKRLKKELSNTKEILDNKGKILTKPTVKDLEKIKWMKDKKNHATSCSCNMCKKERYKRPVQKRIDNEEVEEIELEEPDYDVMNEEWPNPIDEDDDINVDFGDEYDSAWT